MASLCQPTPRRVRWHCPLRPILSRGAPPPGKRKPPRVLRAERADMGRQLVESIVEGAAFGGAVERLCKTFKGRMKELIAGMPPPSRFPAASIPAPLQQATAWRPAQPACFFPTECITIRFT